MSDRPSFETAAAAVAKLDARFGAEDVGQPQRLAEIRLLAIARPDAVEAATVRACRRWNRRPTASELGQLLRDELHGRAPVYAEDFTPPAEVGAQVDEIRSRLGDDGDVRVVWRTADALSASVRDPVAGVVDVRLSDGMWSCTCADEIACHHVRAVQQTMGAVA